MSQIATVELIYVAHSGRQYRAKHVQVHTGWELEDLEQQAKSALSLRDYAIQFVNVNGHKQFIMPTDLETIIVNVVAITEERWEEPDYEALQQKWSQNVKPYGETASERTQETPAPPNPERVRATATALMEVRTKTEHKAAPTDLPGNEDTQSIKVTWPTATRPRQFVNWPRQNGKESALANDETQPMQTIKGEVVAGMSEEDATAVVGCIAAGGTVTRAED